MNKQVARLFTSIDEHKRQSRVVNSANCECLSARADLDRNYYNTQKELIQQTLSKMKNYDQKNTDIVERLLSEMVAYINTILELQSRQILCACKIRQLSKVASLQHTNQFLRNENKKTFKLFQQKCEELDQLKKKIDQFKLDSTKSTIGNLPRRQLLPYQSIQQLQVYDSVLIEIKNQEIKNSKPELPGRYFKEKKGIIERILQKTK